MAVVRAFKHDAANRWVQYTGDNYDEVAGYISDITMGETEVMGPLEGSVLVIYRRYDPDALIVRPNEWVGQAENGNYDSFQVVPDEQWQATHTVV